MLKDVYDDYLFKKDEIFKAEPKEEVIEKKEIPMKLYPVETEGKIILFRGSKSSKTTIRCAEYFFVNKGKQNEISIRVDEETKFKFDYDGKVECLYILAYGNKKLCYTKMILDEETYHLFDSFESLNEKLRMMEWYFNLDEKKQQSIKNQLSGLLYERRKSDDCSRFESITDLENKYLMCKYSYTPQQQADIEELITGLKSSTYANKNKARHKLEILLNIDTADAKTQIFDKKTFIREMKKRIDRMDDVIETLADAIIASQYSNVKGLNILLVGSPGVGKTHVGKAVAEVLGRPYVKLPFGSFTSMLDVNGDASMYDNSDCGMFFKNLYKYGTTQIVCGLDEFDKSNNLKEGNPYNAFNDALSDEHNFHDNYINSSINTENIIFIATANSTETIPEHLLNRFKIIQMKNYSIEDKIHILKHYTLPTILSTFNLTKSSIQVSDALIQYVVENYCVDEGVRDLKKNFEDIVRYICSENYSFPVRLNKTMIHNTLDRTTRNDQPALIYHRNRELYSKDTAKEIERLICQCSRMDLSESTREKCEKKLNYLVTLIPTGNAFENFDVEKAYDCVNKSLFGMHELKDKIIKSLYITSKSNKPLSSLKFLLVGPCGVGKTSIGQVIAKAVNAPYQEISLNGVNSVGYMKGTTFVHSDSDAGIIVKSLYKMKSTKGVLGLGEIDKMNVELQNSLLDVLDSSSKIEDQFTGSIDLNSLMIIATANDLSSISPILLDRFDIVMVDGYSENEKMQIAEKYVMPKIAAEYCQDGYTMSLSNEANQVLIHQYCTSMGVRDVDKALRKIATDKMFACRNEKPSDLILTKEDVLTSLGASKCVRGNVPSVNSPGVSCALAVSGNGQGMTFAIETMVTDKQEMILTGRPAETTKDSVTLAMSFIRKNYPELLNQKGIHLHFGEGAVQKDGPSAGIAILLSIMSAALGQDISNKIASTGEIDLFGHVFAVGGIRSKLLAACKAGCEKVYIPYDNYVQLNEDEINEMDIEIIPVRHVSKVIEEIFKKIEKNR